MAVTTQKRPPLPTVAARLGAHRGVTSHREVGVGPHHRAEAASSFSCAR